MYIFKKAADTRHFIRKLQSEGKKVGFVPTMGALHEGHIQLVRQAMAENDFTVVSIFVNPTQFDEEQDFKAYPRTIHQDIRVLEAVGCSMLFLPGEEEIYPEESFRKRHFDFGDLEKRMEGAHRQGHFQGVAQVVSRLLDIVPADRLYLGQKDFQQVKIITYLVRNILQRNTEIIVCPIIRETDGLAISSRNVRLKPDERLAAVSLYKTLDWARRQAGLLPPENLESEATRMLLQVPEIKEVEYFEIVNADTLQKIKTWNDHAPIIACVAVRMESVRLIDNMILKGSL